MKHTVTMKAVLFVAICICLFITSVSAEERVYVVNSYVHQPTDIDLSTVVMARGSDLAILGTSKNLGDDAHSIAVNPARNEVWVTVPDSNRTIILDARDLSEKQRLKLIDLVKPMGIAFRPYPPGPTPPKIQEVYITGEQSGKVVILDKNTYSVLDSVTVSGNPYAVAFSPDGGQAYILDLTDNTVTVIRTSDRAIIGTLTWGSGNRLQEMALTSTKLYITNQLGDQIEVVRTSDNIKLSPIATPVLYPRALGISPSGTYLFIGYCTGTSDSVVSMMRLSDQTVVSEDDITNCARRMAVRSDGTRIFVVDHNSDELFAYDIAGATLIFASSTGLNTVPGYLGASPVGVALYNANIIRYCAVFRPSAGNNWIYTRDLATVESRDHYGSGTDIPLVTDFNNDGTMDRAVFRNGEWIIDYYMDGSVDARNHYGMAGDIPLVGYLDDDQDTDRAVFRNGEWIVDYDLDGDVDARSHYGMAGDIPLVGDFNNDWIPDRAVFRASAGNNWIIDYNMDGTVDVRNHYGSAGDVPLVGRINTDLFMDRAVFRNGEWIIDYNMDGSVNLRPHYGMTGDKPLTWWDI